ncbi:LLM class flavin-dependent oxidoreductase [Pseudomonas sp. R3.Fl]|uniref:LLM class flavin-dependent oxidoreductase n=1 Tax=Pseudomonas sp. R3.Fl TaxID=2928708 RepID=UPI00201D9EEF|nr:LLM class flavin-dependent oxidoreductase [Pseudomonas sp. R3.Fl]MCL6691718.1 LLM class flavin-dependent oxidoreductase [Pseudomonas sp. R3.Fl]
MPIEIRGRIPFNGKQPLSDTPAGRYAAFFVQHKPRAGADASVIIRAAREQEALGYDSSLIPQNSLRADVWACCGWALAATRQLNLVAAHRIGWQQPTLAARTLATLDRLSGGRQQLHVLQGRTDEDMRRDGDFLDKAERYARSEEYLQVFKRTLSEEQPFDFHGRYYQVRGAHSAVRPERLPTLHFPGASDAGMDLAARHADAWAVAGHTPEQVGAGIERIRRLARERHGRELQRFWVGAFNLILGRSDALAWAKAEAITAEVEAFIAAGHAPQPLLAADDAAPADSGALYSRLGRLSGHGPSLVGSPASVAAQVLAFYRAGVTCFTLGGLCEYHSYDGSDLIEAEDRELLAEVIALIRRGVAEEDRRRASVEPQRERV